MGEIAQFESPVLSIGQDGPVATLWLDRPEARNAMGMDLWRDLPVAMAGLSAEPSVRAVVVAAKGPHFSVGLDLKAIKDKHTNLNAQQLGDAALRQRRLHVGSAAFAAAPVMRPISPSRPCRVSRSSERSGNEVKIPMR